MAQEQERSDRLQSCLIGSVASVSKLGVRSDKNLRDKVEVIAQEGANYETEYDTCKCQSYFVDWCIFILTGVISNRVLWNNNSTYNSERVAQSINQGHSRYGSNVQGKESNTS